MLALGKNYKKTYVRKNDILKKPHNQDITEEMEILPENFDL